MHSFIYSFIHIVPVDVVKDVFHRRSNNVFMTHLDTCSYRLITGRWLKLYTLL